MLDAIAVAATAPSGAHQQPRTFVLVTDPAVRRRIREAAEAEEGISYDGRLGDAWLDDGGVRKQYYVGESVGIAVGMLLTALQVAGLAASTHTPSPMRFLGELLGRPRNEKAFAVIPVGPRPPTASRRKPLDEVLVRI